MKGSKGEGGRGNMGGRGAQAEGHSSEGEHQGTRAGEAVSSRRGAMEEAAAAAYSPSRVAKIEQRAERVEEIATKAFTSQEPGPENKNVPQKNADCGPSALSTAMKALHDVPFSANVGREIARTREEMTGAENHQQPTSPHEIASAARLNGLKAVNITGLKQINEALAQHKVVVQLGEPGHMMNGVNFAGTHPAKPNTMEHFVTVLGRNPLTGKYTVDSSERTGPVQVTAAQMRAFITRENGTFAGVALSNDKHAHIGKTVPDSVTPAEGTPNYSNDGAREGGKGDALFPFKNFINLNISKKNGTGYGAILFEVSTF